MFFSYLCLFVFLQGCRIDTLDRYTPFNKPVLSKKKSKWSQFDMLSHVVLTSWNIRISYVHVHIASRNQLIYTKAFRCVHVWNSYVFLTNVRYSRHPKPFVGLLNSVRSVFLTYVKERVYHESSRSQITQREEFPHKWLNEQMPCEVYMPSRRQRVLLVTLCCASLAVAKSSAFSGFTLAQGQPYGCPVPVKQLAR